MKKILSIIISLALVFPNYILAAGGVPGTPCDDGNPNTINDTSNVNGVCIGGPLIGSSCDDGNIFTVADTYDASGVCVGHIINSVCDDGNPNTKLDKYNADGTCRGVLIGAVCDDNNPDTVDDRINDYGVCVGGTVGGPCDDKNPLTMMDHYNSAGVCVGTPVGTACDDGNPLTVNDVVTVNNKCEGIMIGSACDDGNPLTPYDSYNDLGVCVGSMTKTSVTGNKVCVENAQVDFFPVGDTRGHNVLTKREASRDCNLTIEQQGSCKKWEDNPQQYGLGPDQYNTYESNNFGDSLGSLLAALGAYDQIEHIWSGWKGYCEIGIKSDFSWAEDPMFWASMAMSLLMSTTQASSASTTATTGSTASTTAGQGLLTDSATGQMVNNTANTIGNTVQSGIKAVSDSMSSVTDTINSGIQSVKDSVASMVQSAKDSITQLSGYTFDPASTPITDVAEKQLTEAAIQQVSTNIGRCVMTAGFNMATNIYEYAQSDKKTGLDCDPVDEICGNDGIDPDSSTTDANKVTTMDETEFNNLTEQFANADPSTNIYDYIEVISTVNGVVTFRMKRTNEMAGANVANQEQMEDLKNKMQETQLLIGVGVTAASLAGCIGTASSMDGAQVSSPSSGSRASIRTIGGGLVTAVGSHFPPWGGIIAAAVKIMLYVATSYESIDTCHDADDAQKAGKREENTQKALKFNTCHLVSTECAEYSALATGSLDPSTCVLDGYHYCCYDQLMSKILVEQLKAQLGRDWAHCTGISIRDLAYVSFKQCTDPQISDPNAIDGAHQVTLYDPTKAFQYKYHCIDMTEFLEYLNAQMSTSIDMSDFEQFWNDISEQNTNGGTI
jgi:hypothetical protein